MSRVRYGKVYLHACFYAQRVQSLGSSYRQYVCHLGICRQTTHGYKCRNAANVHGQCYTDISMSEGTKCYKIAKYVQKVRLLALTESPMESRACLPQMIIVSD